MLRPHSVACVSFAGADTANGGAAVGRESPSVEKQKRRTPAWCDRVLWLPGRQLHQLAYGRGELAVRGWLVAGGGVGWGSTGARV
jgi:hypothetical protein